MPIADANIQEDDEDEGDQGSLMLHQEHYSDAEDRAQQGEPLVVILEGGSPARAAGDTGVEHGEVDQGVGCDEEVREQAGYNVEVRYKDADEANPKHCDVCPDGVIVPAMADAEGLEVGEDVVLGEGLEHPGGALEAGDGGRESSGKTPGVNKRSKCRDDLHHLNEFALSH